MALHCIHVPNNIIISTVCSHSAGCIAQETNRGLKATLQAIESLKILVEKFVHFMQNSSIFDAAVACWVFLVLRHGFKTIISMVRVHTHQDICL